MHVHHPLFPLQRCVWLPKSTAAALWLAGVRAANSTARPCLLRLLPASHPDLDHLTTSLQLPIRRKSAQQPAAAVQAAPPPPEPPRESSYQVLEEEFGSLDFDAEIQRMKREGQVGLPATDIDPTPSRRY